jgi:uncharacterized membrane protein YhdT
VEGNDVFKDLFAFEKERNAREALGFYLAYLVLFMVLAFLIGGVAAVMLGFEDFEDGIIVGTLLAIVVCTALPFIVLYKKNQLKNYGLVLIALSSGICALLSGLLLGLIPVSYLTTKKDITDG